MAPLQPRSTNQKPPAQKVDLMVSSVSRSAALTPSLIVTVVCRRRFTRMKTIPGRASPWYGRMTVLSAVADI